MSEPNIIPKEVWDSFTDRSMFHPETMCMHAPDGAMVDFKNNVVVAADGRRWENVTLHVNPKHLQ